MADLVLGIATSHGPSIQRPAESWREIAKKDVHDPRFNYQELLAAAKPGIEAELELEVQQQRHAAAQHALATLSHRIRDAAIDVAVVVSNAHQIRAAEPHPVFSILRAPEFGAADAVGTVFDPGAALSETTERGAVSQRPGHSDLASHLVGDLIEQGFDIACIDALPEGALLDEAFSFCYRWLFAGKPIPVVPVLLSRDLPNQATPGRCLGFGQALRRAVAAYPAHLRVALVASGGLSHQVVDEELDRQVIEALSAGEFASLRNLSRERLNRAPGTPEILNWIAVAAAMAPTAMTLVEYVPCYRSLAGTGQGAAFGYWAPA